MPATPPPGGPEPSSPLRPPEFDQAGDPLIAPAPPERLRRALAAVSSYDVDPSGLQGSVCEYVRTLKSAGLPPEQALVAVKGAVREAGLPHYGVPREIALVDRIVRWCIEEYYRAD